MRRLTPIVLPSCESSRPPRTSAPPRRLSPPRLSRSNSLRPPLLFRRARQPARVPRQTQAAYRQAPSRRPSPRRPRSPRLPLPVRLLLPLPHLPSPLSVDLKGQSLLVWHLHLRQAYAPQLPHLLRLPRQPPAPNDSPRLHFVLPTLHRPSQPALSHRLRAFRLLPLRLRLPRVLDLPPSPLLQLLPHLVSSPRLLQLHNPPSHSKNLKLSAIPNNGCIPNSPNKNRLPRPSHGRKSRSSRGCGILRDSWRTHPIRGSWRGCA